MCTAAIVPDTDEHSIPVTDAPIVSITPISAVTVAPVVKAKSGFVRFIDKVGSFMLRHESAIEHAAVDLEPVLALTPFGPEYDLVVNAIVGMRRTAAASKAAGAEISGVDQMKKVLETVTPALVNILVVKGVLDSHDVHIANYAQVVFDLLCGPAVAAAR